MNATRIYIYKETITNELPNIMKKSKGNIEQDVKILEQLLHVAGEKSMPKYRRKVKVKPKGKSIWNEQIGIASKNSKNAHRIWKLNGAPQHNNNQLKSKMITAKRILRRAQRQAYTAKRDKLAESIMKANTSDNKLFYKLINDQRKAPVTSTKILQMNGKTAEDERIILDMWQEHFQQLAIPALEQQHFDLEKLDLAETQNKIIEKQEKEKGHEIEHISTEEIHKAINKLKSGKSPDEDGITAEHYKYGMEELIPFVIHILNNIITNLDVPQFLKSGILTAILKIKTKQTQPTIGE